ncbi:MAG TPA: ATP phosphoribosyltransferase regulatory subunit [Thermoleophilaceae bacterium]|nr:ATP phosphoribosyltransferase regulatory subunit [Thermoleophilaceae bacterium]
MTSHRPDAGQPAPSRGQHPSGAGAPSRTAPIPPGTRDVLPDEMRELRSISERMRRTFEGAGYGEVHTPAVEYEEVLRRGEEHAAGARYRTFDEQGDVLALRSDMTIPIARVVATRYAHAEPPLRFCYFAHAWRAVERGVGEPREFLQGGLELVGTSAPDGEAEVVALTAAAAAPSARSSTSRPPRSSGTLMSSSRSCSESCLIEFTPISSPTRSRRDSASSSGRWLSSGTPNDASNVR